MARLFAIFCLVLALGASSAFAKSIDQWCEDNPPDIGYKFSFGDLWIQSKYFDHLLVDNRTILANGDWADWLRTEKVREVGIYELQNDVLVWTRWSDCIDLSHSQIFVISRDGRVMANEPVWSENWKDGFFVENGTLNYWSEWFCRDENETRASDEKSYLYTIAPGDRKFNKRNVPAAEICSESWVADFDDKRLQFYWLTPDNPVTPPK